MKKLCMTCGRLDESDATTCPNDGEASWQVIEEAPAPTSDDDSTAKPKKKASK